MNTTKVFNRKKHKELWKWLSENLSSDKEGWPEWEYNDGSIPAIDSDCFACDCAKKTVEGQGRTYRTICLCPLVWPEVPKEELSNFEREDPVFCMNSLYSKWIKLWEEFNFDRKLEVHEQLVQVCLDIMNLPLNPEWEGEVHE